MVEHTRVEALAETLPPEWRAAFVHFVETGDAEKSFLEFIERDKTAQAAVETMFNETAAAFEKLGAALHSASIPAVMKAGDKMPDGTIYAGISPETGKKMYAMPADASVTYTFNEAQEHAQTINACKEHGHDDWHVPTKGELNVLFNNRAAIGGFNVSGSDPSGWYWSSSPKGIWSAWGQRFSDGDQNHDDKVVHSSVRLVR